MHGNHRLHPGARHQHRGHGQHLALDPGGIYPLPNLFVSMLQRMGFEDQKFASSTGVMRGLDLKGA